MATCLSAEPGRKAPYSNDLRWRIVWQRAGMELSFRHIARNLNISISTAHSVYKKFEETGDVSPKVPEGEGKRILTEQQELLVIGLLLDAPTLYLSEVCQTVLRITGVQVSPPTICRIIHRNGLTRKKVQQIALQRSSVYRGDFMADVQWFSPDKFVWVDETGCNKKDQIRRCGYALRGEYPVYHRFLHRGQRISAITALSADGVIALELTKGTVDGSKFVDFIRGKLIAEVQPFDGENTRSILVLDNCSVHHVQEVSELLDEAGILHFFLPPYSPDFNPAEEMFSYIKYYLKNHDEVLQSMQDPIPLLEAAFNSVTQEQCSGWIRHAGY